MRRSAAVGLAIALLAAGAFGTWRFVGEPRDQRPRAVEQAEAPAHPFGFVDLPAESTITGTTVRVSGWALARSGIDRVEVRLDGEPFVADHGLDRSDVAVVYPTVARAAKSGFAFERDFAGRVHGRHRVSVVAIDRQGASHEIGHRSLVAPQAFSRWKPLLDARPHLAGDRFHLLPATSGIGHRGADEIRETYAPYESATMRAGVRVPILYLRTTKGRAHDWTFDPDWDVERRCGERRIADDNLNAAIAYSIARRLPVLFTLNGGVWADATCDVPDWDVNDELERDPDNCQWTARRTVPADDALKGLAGSQSSPEIARALTLNVYAAKPRAYKRRNLQAAARVIEAFARAHPDLFVGVSLDPDVYVLPWYQGAEWFDYNPDTIRQFRHWLQGSGPYRGQGGAGVPDLSAFRRAQPLSLAEVRALAKQPFARWDDVDAPRTFPAKGGEPHWDEWRDPWRVTWDRFRRHLVHVHYSELVQWTIEAGIPADKVFTAQAFTAPDPGFLPQSTFVEGGATDYDSGGVSVEGAVPRRGRLGVILYGESTSNTASTDTGEPPFRIFERMADRFGVVEFSIASLKNFAYRPTYADGYRAFREMTNAGAVLVSPMAWNGWNGIYANKPDYQAYTSWRNTPGEEAALDRMVERANLPAGAKLWSFGNARHRDDDGWSAQAPATLSVGEGVVDVAGDTTVSVLSPPSLLLRADRYDMLVVGFARANDVRAVSVSGRVAGASRWITLAARSQVASLATSAAGVSIPLKWPQRNVVVDRIRIDVDPATTSPVRIEHVALYPR